MWCIYTITYDSAVHCQACWILEILPCKAPADAMTTRCSIGALCFDNCN